MAGSTVVGVLEFFSDEPFPADAELLELLLSVGTQLGRVVERQRSEEARLRALIDNMPASVYLRDLDGRFILVNRQYEEFWGLRHDEIRGKTLFETAALPRSTSSPELNAQVDRERAGDGEPRRREAHVMRARQGARLRRRQVPGPRQLGRVVAVAGIDIDITAQKRSEAELAELLRRVEMARDAAMEAASAKSRFLANMSHELRTPLNAIIGFTRLVSRNAEALPERQVDNLSKILVSAEHLLALIDEILDLSRIEAGEVTPRDRRDERRGGAARGRRLARAARRPAARAAGRRGRRRACPESSPTATSSSRSSSTCSATRSSTPTRGRSPCAPSAVDGRLRVDVSDTGVGIPADELGRIFDEFHRADSPSARAAAARGSA